MIGQYLPQKNETCCSALQWLMWLFASTFYTLFTHLNTPAVWIPDGWFYARDAGYRHASVWWLGFVWWAPELCRERVCSRLHQLVRVNYPQGKFAITAADYLRLEDMCKFLFKIQIERCWQALNEHLHRYARCQETCDPSFSTFQPPCFWWEQALFGELPPESNVFLFQHSADRQTAWLMAVPLLSVAPS